MSSEFLFLSTFIYTGIFFSEINGNSYILNKLNHHSTMQKNYSNTYNENQLLFVPNVEKQLETNEPTSNQTNIPLFLNLIINLSFDNVAKSRKNRKQYGRNRKYLNNEETKELTFNFENNPKNVISEDMGNIFEKIKLKTELQRKKRNIEYQNNQEGNQNRTDNKHNKIEDLHRDDFPKMALLNQDKEVDVSRWLKNWKDILAVSPILSTDKPTKPEVDYIDEWRFSYKVTLYDPEAYNVSNFLCSGILVAPQWVLTSEFCYLGDDVALLIGVHTLPQNISDHTRYGVLKKVYSLRENLELIQMDRPVEWTFKAPEIRSVNRDEMEILLHRAKCSLLSWVPVDLEKGVFELREYPRLVLHPQKSRDSKKNSIEVTAFEPYNSSKKDIGSPVLCDGVLTGILLKVHEDVMTVELLCPVLEWITFFTTEGSYFEVTARRFTLKNLGVSFRIQVELIYLSMMCLIWVLW